MKEYEFYVDMPEEIGHGYDSFTYEALAPTSIDELEEIIFDYLIEDDPDYQDIISIWEELKMAKGHIKRKLAHQIYLSIFKKMDTSYWQHDYEGPVFGLVRGMMEITKIVPNHEEVQQRIRNLPKNNPDGSGYDCGHRCHERAGILLEIAADKDYKFTKIKKLK